ncbi:MAG: hypothetical protein H6760_03250 [Candidatus Nomurabacteria bacterium]|nr:MAG: hypothetical protein H6760_03250 [Candidatus Nomurabacteria bacterium]
MYFSTSQDLFFFVLAVAIAILTAFMVWALFYIIMILRKGYNAVNEIEEKLASLDALFTTVKEHLIHSSSSLKVLVGVVTKLIEVIQKRKQKKTTKGDKKSTDSA